MLLAVPLSRRSRVSELDYVQFREPEWRQLRPPAVRTRVGDCRSLAADRPVAVERAGRLAADLEQPLYAAYGVALSDPDSDADTY